MSAPSSTVAPAVAMPEAGQVVRVQWPALGDMPSRVERVERVWPGGDVDLLVLSEHGGDAVQRTEVGQVWTLAVGEVASGRVQWEAA